MRREREIQWLSSTEFDVYSWRDSIDRLVENRALFSKAIHCKSYISYDDPYKDELHVSSGDSGLFEAIGANVDRNNFVFYEYTIYRLCVRSMRHHRRIDMSYFYLDYIIHFIVFKIM